MPGSFYLDENVPLALIQKLGINGHSAVHTRSLGASGRSDPYHLQAAAMAGRIIVTHDRGFELLHDAWRRWNVTPAHAGILIVPQIAPDDLARALTSFIQSGLPTQNELYRLDPTAGWLKQPYQP